MGTYVRGRLLRAIPVILGVLTLVFMMVHLLPGDPAEAIASQSPGMTQQDVQRIRVQLGLDQPLYRQYLTFLSRLVHGDLGRSIFNGQPVRQMILTQFPSTLELTLAGMSFAIVFGVVLGIASAVRHNSWLDSISMAGALLGVSIPSFWLGLMLIFVFAVRLRWVPVVGGSGISGLILPALTLGFSAAAIIARLVRSSMLEVLGQEYVQTARAKGLAGRTIIVRHALRNALIPVVTIVGLQFGALLGGAVVVEIVFARQGIGRMAVDAILQKDFPVVQGVVLLAALVYVVVNLLVDLLYSLLDPRISYD
ncbi:MAG TPA: nickel ABC transporter permease [Thermomicrobiaceae bacterium]|nr:nickel ABC transporter permease [Thermomicrobiaceae bacterium]